MSHITAQQSTTLLIISHHTTLQHIAADAMSTYRHITVSTHLSAFSSTIYCVSLSCHQHRRINQLLLIMHFVIDLIYSSFGDCERMLWRSLLIRYELRFLSWYWSSQIYLQCPETMVEATLDTLRSFPLFLYLILQWQESRLASVLVSWWVVQQIDGVQCYTAQCYA